MRLYLFNPDTDLALRHNAGNYLPSDSIKLFTSAISFLPMWYAQEDSVILADDRFPSFTEEMRTRFHLPGTMVGWEELASGTFTEICPWGWNATLRNRLLRHGIPSHLLPDDSWLCHYRKMSSRQYATSLAKYFQQDSPYLCGENNVLTSMEEVEAYAKAHTGGCLFKMLWSGSGKGLHWCRNPLDGQSKQWCAKALSADGALTGEPIYNKVGDMAAEFLSDGKGNITFIGYSHFLTNPKGAYTGNLLATNRQIAEWIEQYIPYPTLQEAMESLMQGLGEMYAPYYKGCLGVDMMICRNEADGPDYKLHPRVEVNLRMNMGIVSRLLYDRLLIPGVRGLFRIDGSPQPGRLLEAHLHDRLRNPLVTEGGRIVSGYLSLVPVTRESRYRAWVEVEQAPSYCPVFKP